MRLVILVEEPSMKAILEVILPSIVDTENIELTIIPHQGKSDLKQSMTNKLRSWKSDDVQFVVLIDQDSNDCRVLKHEIEKLCAKTPYSGTLIRIVCHELEAWYLGDLVAVETAYSVDLSHIKNKAKYRNPDLLTNAKQEYLKIIPNHQQIQGAKQVAKFMDIHRNTSPSFKALVDGISRIIKKS